MVLHAFRRIFGLKQRRKKEFLESYKADRIFSISPQQRQNMPDYSRCLYCGLCDVVCPELQIKPQNLSPSYIVGSFSRSLTDYTYFNSDYNCESCGLCQSVCPQDIPIKDIVNFMQEGKQLTQIASA